MSLAFDALGDLSYVDEAIERRTIWNKGHVTGLGFAFHPDFWRRDDHGNLIKFDEYGNRDSPYGWEYDHFPTPKAFGGADHIGNLRPLHCRTNASLGGLLGQGLIFGR